MKKIFIVLLVALPAVAFSQSGMQQEFLGLLGYDEQQIVSLGEAIPEEKFSWRPAEGVRSVGDVLLHVASANYMISSGMGFPLPAGIDLAKIESTKGKKEILDLVKSSFTFVKENTSKIGDANLKDKFKLPFGEFSKQSGLLILLNHSGEHKGQLIAYARMNNITPPWSKKGGE